MTVRHSRIRAAAVLSIAAAVVLSVTSCTADGGARVHLPEQPDTPFEKSLRSDLGKALDDAIALSGASGGVAGVWAPWAGEWVVADGTTSAGGSARMTPDVHFRVGDQTQAMTCTVLLRLVDANVVELDQQVGGILPSLPLPYPVTLKQLCQGTSGIADYTPLLAGQFTTNPTRPWAPRELVSNGLADSKTTAPGGTWAQSSTGFVLLGLALETATNSSWSDLYRQYILDPLALEDTAIPDADTLEVPGVHAHGYITPVVDGARACDSPTDVSRLSPSMGWTAGGVTSTIDDLHVWSQALATGALVSKSSAKKQWQTVPMGADAPQWWSYGLGATQIGPLRGNAAVIPGSISAAYSDPDSGLTVAVMLNNSTAGAGFARSLALQLASLASMAPATAGHKEPNIQLPWSADQMAAALAKAAVCAPADAAAAAG